MRSTQKTGAGKRASFSMSIAAGIAVVVLSTLSAAPAHANGAFNVKLTASGCTEGDYYGTSYNVSSGGVAYAAAKTSYTNPICISGIPGVRAIGGSSVTAWQYNFRTVQTQIKKSAPSAAVYGNHSVDDAYRRNT